jgi:hypothetical protein
VGSFGKIDPHASANGNGQNFRTLLIAGVDDKTEIPFFCKDKLDAGVSRARLSSSPYTQAPLSNEQLIVSSKKKQNANVSC